MTAVFADTFYWVALTSVHDSAHSRVGSFQVRAAPDAICTTQGVLTEYLNYFAEWGASFRLKASVNVRDILKSETVRVVEQTSASFVSGLNMYRARMDKGYSLTDSISMQTMRRERLIDVLTNDRHFEQEGFRALFRNSF